MLSEIRKPIESELQIYQEVFDSSFDCNEVLLREVLSYVRKQSGKMMRPILLLLSAKEVGEVALSTYETAVSLELLHTASLVHDDIVDESDERRGQASVNAAFGNKEAVLLGDFLLSLALEKAALTRNVEIVKYISLLGKKLAEGEFLQLSNIQRTDFSETVYFEIIKRKTAALFRACMYLGVLSLNGSTKQLDAAEKIGDIIGICFQIKDDIFDYLKNDIGKPTGNDMREGKLTLPIIYALNKTNNEIMKSMAKRVKAQEATIEEIHILTQFAIEEGGIDYSEKKMNEFVAEALVLIDSFNNEEVKKALKKYLAFVIDRKL